MSKRFLCGKPIMRGAFFCERDEHHGGRCMGATTFPYGVRGCVCEIHPVTRARRDVFCPVHDQKQPS